MLSPMSPIFVDQHALFVMPSGIYKRYILLGDLQAKGWGKVFVRCWCEGSEFAWVIGASR